MSDDPGSLVYRRLRPPREDGEALLDPPLADETGFLARNLVRRTQWDRELGGCRLSDLQSAARRSLLDQARSYTLQYRDVPDRGLGPDAPLILAGHQPELVHSGVWFKNFVLAALAQRTGAHAVHLLIDNDAVKSPAIRVPSGSPHEPVTHWIALDQASTRVPYEERRVYDRELFRTFGQRVAAAMQPLLAEPLIRDWWPLATASLEKHGNLGRAVAEARHILEGQWGLSTWELPWSQVCDDWPFRWFAVYLLGEAERLWHVHNSCLAEYRRVNRVRSHTHPVPDLGRHGGWLEVPFWLWTLNHPERRPVFVRREDTTLVVSDRQDLQLALPVGAAAGLAGSVERLETWHSHGVRLRPRALLTTMFARLVLSDIFIHGIGGAKYDQLTDAIVQRFWGLEPLEYLVATATLRLPLPRDTVEIADLHSTDQHLRHLRFHPECYVEHDAAAQPLVAQKRQWITRAVPASQRRVRHQQIEQINRSLGALLEDRRAELMRQRHELRSRWRSRAIRESREYAFCLFPADTLRLRLLELSGQGP